MKMLLSYKEKVVQAELKDGNLLFTIQGQNDYLNVVTDITPENIASAVVFAKASIGPNGEKVFKMLAEEGFIDEFDTALDNGLYGKVLDPNDRW